MATAHTHSHGPSKSRKTGWLEKSVSVVPPASAAALLYTQ